jgi:cyclophilin family peptidyl-prolyl cis-trans isomerase
MTEALTATLMTTQGTVTVRLFPDHAPKTVRNFVELAEGGREWTNPVTRAKTKDKLYDGTIFHRVITGFMIQAGDPLGNGTGGPGYKFADEIHPDLRPTPAPAPTARSSSSRPCPRRGSPASTRSSARSSAAPTWWRTSAACRPSPATVP